MSSQISPDGPQPTVRIQVEPVEVELEPSDNSLLLFNLQTAFPSCAGLYYRAADNSRVIVKFDGKKFFAPDSKWNGHNYFVNFGRNAIGNYESATKQFERSVNLVQKMMESVKHPAGKTLSPPSFTDFTTLPSVPILPNFPKKNGNIFPKLEADSPKQRESPIEQQFVDLTNITIGQDKIIGAQRNQIKTLNTQMRKLNNKLEIANSDLTTYKAKHEAQERELEMLREMGREQNNMCNEIKKLEAKLCEIERISDEKICSLENALRDRDQQINRLCKRVTEDSRAFAKVNADFEDSKLECFDLTKMKTKLENQLAKQTERDQTEIGRLEKCKDELVADNLRLYEINEELRQEIERQKQLYNEMEEKFAEEVRDVKYELNQRNQALTERFESQKEQIIELSALVETIARENRAMFEKLTKAEQEQNMNGKQKSTDKIYKYSQEFDNNDNRIITSVE
ncbi:hypothetical protein DdX_05590 [Ditylenchus destructor]|uniref:TAR DNA-binding protein 43 N-terminal domain-containing protein n=1 Tax=Ditylenchus destructor TaxID=166010 RepID=A0AAD4N7J0_9BILA|nr:hypothetical protein DdX_05590 [Ditylenchus destructor]